jgi:hypothetical protein
MSRCTPPPHPFNGTSAIECTFHDMMYKISGGNRVERALVDRCLEWCIVKFPLNGVHIDVRLVPITSAHGWVEHEDGVEFTITISTKYPSLSLLTETILHELVHVRQWCSGEWEGDGEEEADRVAREISIMLWNANLI